MLYYDSWCKVIHDLQTGVHASVFVRSGSEILVNLDPQISSLLRESKALQRMGFDIPTGCTLMLSVEDRTKQMHSSLQAAVNRYVNVKHSLDPVFAAYPKMTEALVLGVEELVDLGETKISWTSMGLEDFVKSFDAALDDLGVIVDRMNDIYTVRFLNALSEIKNMKLLKLEPEKAVTITDFVASARESSIEGTRMVAECSKLAELAAKELVFIVVDALDKNHGEYSIAFEQLGELAKGLEKANTDAIFKCVRTSLESIKKRMPHRGFGTNDDDVNPPMICTDVVLEIPNIKLRPSLDESQQGLNGIIEEIKEGFEEVPRWSKLLDQEEMSEGGEQLDKNYKAAVVSNKDVIRVTSSLSSVLKEAQVEVEPYLAKMKDFEDIYASNKDEVIGAFLKTKPDISAFEDEVTKYEKRQQDVLGLEEAAAVGSMELTMEPFKLAVVSEAKAWKSTLGKALNEKAKEDMSEILEFCDDQQKALSRPITDLEDVRLAMESLKAVREKEIQISMTLGPLEHSYALLNKYGIAVPREEMERVEGIAFSWKKLNQSVTDVGENLGKIQGPFQDELITSVEQYIKDVATFKTDWEKGGPLVAGIKPSEASDRLSVYQVRFDDLWRKYNTYTGGEALFGLPVTDHPDIPKFKKDLNLLNRLYSLYNLVLSSISGYYDILWTDVDTNAINDQLLEFASKAKKCPKP
jgi:dynein heavy chain